MKTYVEHDILLHFEKLLDEFEEDALAAAQDNSNTPSASKRIQRDLTRSHLVALVTEIATQNVKDLDAAVGSSNNEDRLRKERNLLHVYLYDAVGDMSPDELSSASNLIDLDYCKEIIDRANEYKP